MLHRSPLPDSGGWGGSIVVHANTLECANKRTKEAGTFGLLPDYRADIEAIEL